MKMKDIIDMTVAEAMSLFAEYFEGQEKPDDFYELFGIWVRDNLGVIK